MLHTIDTISNQNKYLYEGEKHGQTNDEQDPSYRNDRRRREKENQRSMAGTIR